MMAGYINSAENNLKSKKEHFVKRIEESRKEKESKLKQAKDDREYYVFFS